MSKLPELKKLNELMGGQVYAKYPMTRSVQIMDTKKCVNVIFCGPDMVVHVVTLWDDDDHKDTEATVTLKMVQDTRVLDIKTFGKKHGVDKIIEAIQDAVIASEGATPVLHDDEGFQVLRPSRIEIIKEQGDRYLGYGRTDMVDVLCYHRTNNAAAYMTDSGWRINTKSRNIHYELVDAIIMIFNVVGTGNQYGNYDSYNYGNIMRRADGFYLIGEMLELLKATGGYEDPRWAADIIDMLTENTVTVENCRSWRESDAKRQARRIEGKKMFSLDPNSSHNYGPYYDPYD